MNAVTGMPARLLRLLSLLQGRREWPGAELAERLGVTDRTIRRDIDRLRGLGYPVEGTTGTAGGYRLAAGANLPPLLLDDDEAIAVALALTAPGPGLGGMDEVAGRALAKLLQVLPPRLRHRIDALRATMASVAYAVGPQADPGVLAALAAACRDHEMVSFAYRDRRGRESSRRVEPHHLVTAAGRWSLIAYEPAREGWRTFRVDRISEARPLRLRFTQRELPAPDPATYLARVIAPAPYDYRARIVVADSAEAVRGRLSGPLPGEIEALDDRTCVVHLRTDSADLIAQHLAGLGAPFTVEGSPDLLEHLRTVGQRLRITS